MKTKLTFTAVFALLVLALPALAQEATQGGQTSSDGSIPAVRGMPALDGNDTPACNDCMLRTVAGGDIGLPKGVYTGGGTTGNQTNPAAAGSNSGN